MEKFGSRETNLSEVVGVSAEEAAKSVEDVKNPSKKSEKHYAEIEKMPEEVELVEAILKKMPKFLEKYNVEALALSADNIHLLNKDLLTRQDAAQMGMLNSDNQGFCRPLEQFIGITRVNNKLDQAQMIVHEVLHLNCFLSAKKKDGLLTPRRIGAGIPSKDEKTIFFGFLDEAIVAELTKRFDNEYFSKIPSLAKDLDVRRRLVADVASGKEKRLAGRERDITSVKRTQHTNGAVETRVNFLEYPEPRAEMWKLIGEIAALPKNRKLSKEDIFNVFAKAALTGRLLGSKKDPGIARMIKDARPGKHSFRDFGNVMGKSNIVTI